MASSSDFHNVTFPIALARGTAGGPQRSTEIITLGSGAEQRNQRWLDSRRRFDAGSGVKSLDALHEVIGFYEARRGPLYGFRFRDPADYKSCNPSQDPSSEDQTLGIADGVSDKFQLVKSYGTAPLTYQRTITHPVAATVLIALDGVEQVRDTHFTLDDCTGLITFSSPPLNGVTVTAGFEFDVPVRFDSDQLVVNLAAFAAGEVPSIPLLELRQ